VDIELGYRKKKGAYKASFSVVCSFIGYQARGAAPSNFDVNYAYNLGFAATRLVAAGYTGYVATISNLRAPVVEWSAAGVPITAMLAAEDGGKYAAPKAQVDLNGPAYAALVALKDKISVRENLLYSL
jgi:6-phosphofructokinase